jgi:hypothetical protein
MKKLLFTLGLAACFSLAGNAQSSISATSVQDTQAGKSEIQFAQAPAPVQRAFTVENVNPENVTAVYEITEGEKKIYKVKFTKNGKTYVSKYTPDGNLIDRQEKVAKTEK